MQVDRVLFPIESLGPGNRLVIWTIGCSKHCPNCSNSELWERDEERDIPVDELVPLIMQAIQGRTIDGITITGGDPFEQYDDLMLLLAALKPVSEDILVYTGYTLQEIDAMLSAEEMSFIRSNIDVLIDGRYVDAFNDNSCVLRGSSNQVVHFLNRQMEEHYQRYMDAGRKIQNVFYQDKVISVGIHMRENRDE